MQRTVRVLLPTALSLLGSTALLGCSLLGLDNIPITECNDNSVCEPLNQKNGVPVDACMRYQCAEDRLGCVLRVRDVDKDGAPPPQCGGKDCDDTDSHRV